MLTGRTMAIKMISDKESDSHRDARFSLKLPQEPLAALRLNHTASENERSVYPTLKVQLIVDDPDGALTYDSGEIQARNYVLACSISEEQNSRNVSSSSSHNHRQQLFGTLVSGLSLHKDGLGQECYFFQFPGIFCQMPGEVRLTFVLGEIETDTTGINGYRFLCMADDVPFNVRMLE